MFTQKVILNFDSKSESMFIKRKGNEISFDTFFNSFNVYAIKHYTDGKTLKINLEYEGDASIKVIHLLDKEQSVLYSGEHLVNTIEIDLQRICDKGLIFPVFSGNFKLKSMSYEVDATSKKITPAVIFTTFNRQEFLIPNLRKLNTCENIDKVIVVDNAKNVVLPDDLSKNKFIVNQFQ